MEILLSPFGIRVPVKENVFSRSQISASDVSAVPIIEGTVEYDTLCPVNPLTGHRDNPLTILRDALSPRNERLLSSILQELPSIQEYDAPDDVKLQMLTDRLDLGDTFAESDIISERLSKVASVLFADNSQLKQEVQQTVENNIEFDSGDAKVVDNV